MPKVKTNKSASKRFKRTASGGLKRSRAYGAKNNTNKSQKRKRNLRKLVMLEGVDIPRMNRLLPYK
jgi:large subunit ribosomal protein L35